jgi:hypothetical protein
MKTTNSGAGTLQGYFPEDRNLVRYARNLGAGSIWRQRQMNHAAGSLLRAAEMDCITNCTECVTSCTECVASPGGGCGLTSLVASPCVPKPDIGEQDF